MNMKDKVKYILNNYLLYKTMPAIKFDFQKKIKKQNKHNYYVSATYINAYFNTSSDNKDHPLYEIDDEGICKAVIPTQKLIKEYIKDVLTKIGDVPFTIEISKRLYYADNLKEYLDGEYSLEDEVFLTILKYDPDKKPDKFMDYYYRKKDGYSFEIVGNRKEVKVIIKCKYKIPKLRAEAVFPKALNNYDILKNDKTPAQLVAREHKKDWE